MEYICVCVFSLSRVMANASIPPEWARVAGAILLDLSPLLPPDTTTVCQPVVVALTCFSVLRVSHTRQKYAWLYLLLPAILITAHIW